MMTIDGLPRLLLSVICNAIQHYVDNMIVRGGSIWETNINIIYRKNLFSVVCYTLLLVCRGGVNAKQIPEFFYIERLPNVSQWVLVMT